MQHPDNNTPDIELLVARQARYAAERRLLAAVDDGFAGRSLRGAVRHYAVAVALAAALAAGVVACTSEPDGRDIVSSDRRGAVLGSVNYVIENL